VDVTEPSTPDEVILSVLDDYLAQLGDDEELDTQDLTDNLVHRLRRTGFVAPAEGDSQ